MASLEHLPAPLPLSIIKHLPDLRSLHALRLSSPLCAAVFNLHAREVFETLMLKSLSREVLIELRTYTLLRTRESGLPHPTTEEVNAVYVAAERALLQTIPAFVIGHTLNVFCELASACDVIFSQKLQRVYKLPHEHLADKRWGRWSKMKKVGIPYELPPPSPPDWVEQQRLLRAALRLTIWRTTGMEYVDPRKDSPIFGRWRNYDKVLVIDEVMEIIDALSECQGHGLIWESLATKPALDPKDVEQGKLAIARRPRGYEYFHDVGSQYHSYSPLKGADWKIMRSLGFGVWSDRRLFELGLQDPAHSPISTNRRGPRPIRSSVLTYNNVLFTWKALYDAATAKETTIEGGNRNSDLAAKFFLESRNWPPFCYR